MGWRYVPLWALLPALKNRETAIRYMANAERELGRPLTDGERTYLEDVIEQGNRVKEWLRRLGYYDPGARGELLRRYRITADTEEEAKQLLAQIEKGEFPDPHTQGK
jgi:hypothetical protein